MTRKILVEAAGEHPVEAAIREGKIPESRRAHYMAAMATSPKKTTRLLAKLEAVLLPEEDMDAVREYVRNGGQAAPAVPVASGPTDYPRDWLAAREGSGRPAPGPITFEDTMAAVGGFSPEFQ